MILIYFLIFIFITFPYFIFTFIQNIQQHLDYIFVLFIFKTIAIFLIHF